LEYILSCTKIYLKGTDQSFDAMQGTIARMKLSTYPPDIEIEIPRNLYGTLEFTRAWEMIDYEYEKCKSVIIEYH